MRLIAGSDDTIPGWSYGVIGMCVGEQRRLTVPPEWGFGEATNNNNANTNNLGIPPGATLQMTLDLVSTATPPNLFAEIDTNRDAKLSKQELTVWLRNKGVPANELARVAQQLLEQDDANRDGFIQWTEYSGPRGNAPPPAAARSSGNGNARGRSVRAFAVETESEAETATTHTSTDSDSNKPEPPTLAAASETAATAAEGNESSNNAPASVPAPPRIHPTASAPAGVPAITAEPAPRSAADSVAAAVTGGIVTPSAPPAATRSSTRVADNGVTISMDDDDDDDDSDETDAEDDDDDDDDEDEAHTRFNEVDRERARLLLSSAPASVINARLNDLGLHTMPEWRPEFERFVNAHTH